MFPCRAEKNEICSECVHTVHLLKRSWQEAKRKYTNYYSNLFAVVLLLGSQALPCLSCFSPAGIASYSFSWCPVILAQASPWLVQGCVKGFVKNVLHNALCVSVAHKHMCDHVWYLQIKVKSWMQVLAWFALSGISICREL